MPLQSRLIALMTFLVTIQVKDGLATSFDGQLIQNPKSKMQNSQVLAQTPEPRKAEADRLFQQGIELFQANQFQAAIQFWKQALNIYREIGERDGEANSLGKLGNAYYSLEQYQQAIEFFQRQLAVVRQIGNRAGEANSLYALG
ncbi:tetratricopeptide repeat protein [Microseira wollei]|uniref:TPR repeat-containing protein n=1 Tax=Microseira wollei NIES-4236 TaxID=2530354 RepID=A0AAV3XFX8_9CYAN|nr:tetratricopeptide repeat protein [Microseira wollei]GET39611.1 TPR repeat-containing protein [Microseira wollei NIES-4236]